MLVIQADNMQERRRQSAKTEVLRTPGKIVFSLVSFFFLALEVEMGEAERVGIEIGIVLEDGQRETAVKLPPKG